MSIRSRRRPCFNPSIVRHPDQTGAPEGGCRFILSLRAVGEGHISSLTFRSGSIAADGSVTVDPQHALRRFQKFENEHPGKWRRCRSHLRSGRRTERARHLFRSLTANQTASRTPDLSNSTTVDGRHFMQLIRPIAAERSVLSCSRRRTFSHSV